MKNATENKTAVTEGRNAPTGAASQENATMKKLWTGRTPRQELVETAKVNAFVNGGTIAMAIESVLDGAEAMPEGSPKREMLRYWNAAYATGAYERVVAEIKSLVRHGDRLMGRQIKR